MAKRPEGRVPGVTAGPGGVGPPYSLYGYLLGSAAKTRCADHWPRPQTLSGVSHHLSLRPSLLIYWALFGREQALGRVGAAARLLVHLEMGREPCLAAGGWTWLSVQATGSASSFPTAPLPLPLGLSFLI